MLYIEILKATVMEVFSNVSPEYNRSILTKRCTSIIQCWEIVGKYTFLYGTVKLWNMLENKCIKI